jgi:hypothetical protein
VKADQVERKTAAVEPQLAMPWEIWVTRRVAVSWRSAQMTPVAL